MRVVKAACLVLGALAFAAPALAEESAALRGYTRTGETTDCLKTYRIRDTQILNNKQILFRMYGGDAYLQEPASCPTLNKWQALQYQVYFSELCTNTIVTLLDTGSSLQFDGTCGFSDFQRLKRADASAR